jgi:hypothetical protein
MKRVASQSLTATGPRWGLKEGLLASRPAVYICMLLTAVLAGFVYQVRTRTIFACQASGYSTDRYLAYCNGANYADFEHGAFLFDLVPPTEAFVRDADVLFLGNSRLQIGLSTAETENWFTAASASYYLMGFSYFENELFARELLRKIAPRASVYVINVDDFFDLTETPPVKALFHNPELRDRYEWKYFWQGIHNSVCGRFTQICGNEYTVFRSRRTGAYYVDSRTWKNAPASYDNAVDWAVVDRNAAVAAEFLSHVLQRKCVILTLVPYVGTKIGTARAIAARLGKRLVVPADLEDLRTFDGLHLDRPSAVRWSEAFLQVAGPEIKSCLEQEGVTHQ